MQSEMKVKLICSIHSKHKIEPLNTEIELKQTRVDLTNIEITMMTSHIVQISAFVIWSWL